MDERIERALNLIGRYGSIDGAHHKQWVLDQVVRALTDCPADEEDGSSRQTSEAYLEWLGKEGWDEGIAP